MSLNGQKSWDRSGNFNLNKNSQAFPIGRELSWGPLDVQPLKLKVVDITLRFFVRDSNFS